MSHSPGPWRWCEGFGEEPTTWLESSAGHAVIAPHFVASPGEADANLIAHAPEMFEALKACADRLSRLGPGWPDAGDVNSLLRRIEGAGE